MRIDYHGLSLVTQKKENFTEIYEPAYDVHVSSVPNNIGNISNFLDEKSLESKDCEKSKNFIPEIVKKIIISGAKIKNKNINRLFAAKVEKIRNFCIENSKKVALTTALTIALTAMPQFSFAESNRICSFSYEQLKTTSQILEKIQELQTNQKTSVFVENNINQKKNIAKSKSEEKQRERSV